MRKPYITFWPDRWLSDIGLRSCHPIARAYWIDILCIMAQGEPYGHLQIRPPATPQGKAATKAATKAAAQAHAQAVAQAVAQAGAQAGAQASAQAGAQASAPAGAQAGAQTQHRDFACYEVPNTGSLEPMLPQILSAPADLIEWAIAHLEQHNVFSRTPEGIIYSRRMVRDDKQHREHVERGRRNQQKQAIRRKNAQQERQQGNGESDPTIKARPRGNPRPTPRPVAQASAQAVAQAGAQAVARPGAQAGAQAGAGAYSTSNYNRKNPSPPTPSSASGKGGIRPKRVPSQDTQAAAVAILKAKEARRK